MVLLSVALEAAERPHASGNHRASAEKLCILSENAAAASAQALAALLLLCDGILTSNLPSDRAPRHENIACSLVEHCKVTAQVL